MQHDAPIERMRGKETGVLKRLRFGSSKADEWTPLGRPPVDEEVYDADSFAFHAGGAEWYERFVSGEGKEIYPIYRQAIEHIKPEPNERFLDIGCGRGEITGILAMKGVKAFGLDFSSAALRYASTVRDAFTRNHGIPCHLVRADATALPFPEQSFDHIVLLDIVEHLHSWQLKSLYSECWRVLRPRGSVIVHTWPNLWHTRYTYPLIAQISRLLSIPRPLNHRKPHDEVVHVNEQSPRSLRNGLHKARFRICRSWCEHNAPLALTPNSIVYWLFHRTPGLRLFFADHLWVIAAKD